MKSAHQGRRRESQRGTQGRLCKQKLAFMALYGIYRSMWSPTGSVVSSSQLPLNKSASLNSGGVRELRARVSQDHCTRGIEHLISALCFFAKASVSRGLFAAAKAAAKMRSDSRSGITGSMSSPNETPCVKPRARKPMTKSCSPAARGRVLNAI